MFDYFFRFVWQSVGLELVIIMLVSSVKIRGMEVLRKIVGLLTCMYKKSKGPRIDPRGTPCEILPKSEEVVLWRTFETISTL